MDAATRILFDGLCPAGTSGTRNAEDCDWETVWIKSRDHGLVPFLNRQWTESGFMSVVPPNIGDRFSDATLGNARRNDQMLSILSELETALQKKHIPMLILKGLPISQTYYGDHRIRVLYDVDLLIKASDKTAALEILQRLGYVPFPEMVNESRYQCLLWKPKSYEWGPQAIFDPVAPYFVEIHTKPWEPHWHGFRMDCSLDSWKGARIQEVAGIQLRAPCEEKLLVHLAVHFACNVLESNARLMHLLDLILLLRSRSAELSWGLIWDEIKSSNVAPFCFLSLELARQAGAIDYPRGFRLKLRNSTPKGIVDWLGNRGIEDIGSINPRECNRPLIYLLHWNMAANWKERMGILLYSLRAPWNAGTGLRRMTSFVARMAARLTHLSRASRRN